TYTLAGACGGGDTAIIVVTPPIVSNAGPNVSLCAGDSVLIGADSTAGYTYSWQPSSGLNNPNSSKPYLVATNAGTTSITASYVLTTGYSGCTAKDTVVVTVNPQPQLEITSPSAVCASIPVDITQPAITSGTSGGGVLSYWTNSNATTVLTNPSSITVAGTYYIKATATGGCFDLQPVVVTLNPAPTASAGSDISICTGDTVFIGDDSVVGNAYLWTPSTGISNNAISNPSLTLTNNGSAPQTLVYVVTATANSCSDTDTINITVNPHPVANAGVDIEVCAGTSATLNGSVLGVSGGAWSGGSGTYSPSNNILNAEYTPTLTELTQGSLSLILTTDAPQGGCAVVKDTVELTFALPAIANAGSDDTICAGGAVVLNASFLGSATSGSWSGGDGVFSPDNTQLNASYVPSAAEIEAGSLALIYTTDDPVSACLADNDTVLIEIQPSPVADAGVNQLVCAGSSINLSANISGSATSAVWSGGQGVFMPSQNSLTPIYIPSLNEQNADSVVLYLTTDNPIGFPCNAHTDSVTIHFSPKPITAFSVTDSAGCPQHCVNFNDLTNINGGTAIDEWIWNFGDNSNTDTTQNPTHCYEQMGVYDVTLIVTSQDNCKDTLLIPQFIQVYATPLAAFDYTPNPATVSSTNITLNNLSSADVVTWAWSFGDGDSLLSDSSTTVHLYPNDSPETYQTTLIVQNSFGCADTITNNVVIYPEFSFFIPNAFTPNGDDVNDLFGAKGMGIEIFELMIFDRWGNMVFFADDINKMWDGTFTANDEQVAQDVYVWKVKITDVFRKKYDYIGTVTVIR
ncbi:MAG: PKD domain-containing protein, partial [Bacteroidia bacterium]